MKDMEPDPVFLTDPNKDPDPVEWPKYNKWRGIRIRMPDENVSFLAASVTFKHCFRGDPDPIDVGNSVLGSGSGQPGSDR